MVRHALVAALCLAACQKKAPQPPPPPAAAAKQESPKILSLTNAAGAEQKLDLDALRALAPPQIIETQDDQYGRRKRFRALSMATIFDRTLGREAVRGNEILLRALDGYVISLAGSRLYDGDAYLAFDDADVPGFEPIGPKRVDPGPYYLIWPKDEQHDLVQWPRPYQLSNIAIATYASRFPHTLPEGAEKDELVNHGFGIWKSLCVHCHAINREGGRVGPDLNVPKNVLEYWTEDNFRAYVKNPQTFRYGNMPPNPQLTDRDLDGIVAYLRYMQTKKHE